jgi:hypothetical protein
MRQDDFVYFIGEVEKEVGLAYSKVLFGHLRHLFLYILCLSVHCGKILKLEVASSCELPEHI